MNSISVFTKLFNFAESLIIYQYMQPDFISGVVWNILSLVTISTIPKKSLFHKLLITLTTFDTLFLMSGGIFMIQQSLKFESSIFNTLFPKILYPMAGISMTGKLIMSICTLIRNSLVFFVTQC